DASACAAADQYGGELIHAGAVIADRPIDLDSDGDIETGGNCVSPCGMADDPMPLIGIGPELVQRLVEGAERRRAEIDLGHCLAFPEIDRGGLGLPDARVFDTGEAGERA